MALEIPWTTEEFNGMPYRVIGNSGLKASNIGLGTWKFGYPETGDGSRVDEITEQEIQRGLLESGSNQIPTREETLFWQRKFLAVWME